LLNKIVISGFVVVHLIASIWHGDAHTRLAIDLPPEKNLFVYIVILIAPLVALILVWTRYATIGLWVLAISMVGALLFGAYHHYVLVSPDNIGHLPEGSPQAHTQFTSSAAVIALLELAASLYATFCLGSRWAQPRGR
jgi:amino acid permease